MRQRRWPARACGTGGGGTGGDSPQQRDGLAVQQSVASGLTVASVGIDGTALGRENSVMLDRNFAVEYLLAKIPYATSNWNRRPVLPRKNPTVLAEWYREHLGIALARADYSQKPWSQDAGPTVFAPFPHDSDYFGNSARQWMINFRVRNLDAMVEQLRAAKIDVVVDSEKYPNGRFARLHDPEGNPIELWESI